MNVVAEGLPADVHGSSKATNLAGPTRMPAGSFSVGERTERENRVLIVLDTRADAEEIAAELRTPGLRVEVRQAQP